MNWVQRFKEQGINGLVDRTGRGAQPFLSPEGMAAFKQSVVELQQKKSGGLINLNNGFISQNLAASCDALFEDFGTSIGAFSY